MKKYDLVKLINESPYLKYNLTKNAHGIIINSYIDTMDVMFFNPQNYGDYIIVKIKAQDLILEKEKLPNKVIKEFEQKKEKIISKAKEILQTLPVKAYNIVELIVEDEKYTKFGIHKGDRGCVMDDIAVDNCVEVDFSGIDEDRNYYGDCISVNIKDLKVIK
ncbi:MAG: hypothetical protein ACLRFL_02090 [Clostridia bacterium]